MEKTCVIIAGGNFSPVWEEEAFVIACDRGWEYACRAGIRPDLVIGDFDSCKQPPAGTAVVTLPREKDDTDTMAAVKYAAAHGFQQVVFCCALGGRLDHTYANIQSALFAVQRGLRAFVLGEDTKIRFAREETILVPREEGFSLSVFSAGEMCSGVTIRGTKYELTEACLSGDFPLGISNEWMEPEAEITVRQGILMIMSCRL